MKGPTRAGFAILGGLALAMAAPPFPTLLAFGGWLGVALLGVSLVDARPGRAFARGFLFGFVVNLVAMAFVPETITRFTDLPLAAAVAAWFLLAAGQGLAWSIGALVTALARRVRLPLAIALPLGIATVMVLPSLFPWTIAAPFARVPLLLQPAESIGERGIAVVVAVSSAMAAMAWVTEGTARRRHALGSFAVMMVLLVYGLVSWSIWTPRIANAPRRSIALVQQAIPPKDRWKEELSPAILAKLWSLTREGEKQGATLAIWPEAAYPYVLPHAPSREFGPNRIRGPGIGIEVLTGLLTIAPAPLGMDDDPKARWHYNAATIVDREGNVAQPSAKIELLAFGEVVPLGERFPALRRMFARGGGLRPGTEVVLLATRSEGAAVRAGILNCYEDTIPDVARRVGMAGPNLLVNVTNDAWFGVTAEPDLHLLAATARAIETRRDMLRAVNTGVTVHVDAFGRVVARAEREVAAVLLVQPALLETPPTLYVRYGDLMWGLPLIASALVVAIVRRQRRAGLGNGESDRPPSPS